jgi:hypothetical protein
MRWLVSSGHYRSARWAPSAHAARGGAAAYCTHLDLREAQRARRHRVDACLCTCRDHCHPRCIDLIATEVVFEAPFHRPERRGHRTTLCPAGNDTTARTALMSPLTCASVPTSSGRNSRVRATPKLRRPSCGCARERADAAQIAPSAVDAGGGVGASFASAWSSAKTSMCGQRTPSVPPRRGLCCHSTSPRSFLYRKVCG